MDQSKYSDDSMASTNTIVAFDLYGTLLNTASIATKLSEHFGKDKGPDLAAKWRVYQLEYTWRLNSMEQYEPFSTLTDRALRHVLAEASLTLSDAQIQELMQAYDSLSAFPDVAPTLTALASLPHLTPLVFSNGTDAMVSNSVTKSADLAPHAHIFKELVTVEQPRRYKPAPVVYAHLAQKMGKSKGEMGQMWLVSGNPFDVVGARAVGMKAAWVDRAGGGWVDRLGLEPTVVLKSLEDLPDAIKKHSAT